MNFTEYVSPNNLNYYIHNVIAYYTDDYYYTDYNDIPEPYHSKVLQYCKEKGYDTLLVKFSLEEVFKQSINMDLKQVKALINKRNAILRKKEEIEKDFEQ